MTSTEASLKSQVPSYPFCFWILIILYLLHPDVLCVCFRTLFTLPDRPTHYRAVLLRKSLREDTGHLRDSRLSPDEQSPLHGVLDKVHLVQARLRSGGSGDI